MLVMMSFFLLQGLVLFLLRQAFGGMAAYYEEISLFLLIVNTLFFVFISSKEAKNKTEYVVLLAAYGIRVCTLLFDFYARDIFVLPSSGVDTEVFHQYAVYFSQGRVIQRGGVYFRIVGTLYRLFGVQRITAQYFNVLLSVWVIVLVKKTLALLNLSEKTRRLALLFIAFLPYYITMSAILLRESVIIFLIAISLYYFVRWWQKGRFLDFIVAVVCPLVAALFHSGSMAPAVAYAWVYLFYVHKEKKYHITWKSVLMAGVFFGSFILIDAWFGSGMFRQFNRIASVDDIANVTVRGEAGYLRWMEASGTLGIVVFSPIRMFYFVSAPLPWYWRGINDVFGFLGSSWFYVVSYALLFSQQRDKKNPSHALLVALLLVALFSSFMFAWGVNNAGAALRHRDKFISIFVVGFAVAWESRKLRGKRAALP